MRLAASRQLSHLHASDADQFRQLLSMLPMGAYTCDAEGLITSYNQRAVEVWGREPALNEPVDRYCGSFRIFTAEGQPLPHENCWMALALQNGRGYNGKEVVVERPDGGRSTLLAHANPLFDEAGAVVGAVNILIDITERRQAEDLLRQSDRRKSEFLALLSHELRNPLAPLRNGLAVLRLAANNPAAAEQTLSMMERQLGQLTHLIDDLLDLTRITRGKIVLRRERVALQAAVRDAVESCQPLFEEQGHQFTLDAPEQPLFVEGDATRLAQIFANLLDNAAKYTDHGGHILLALEEREGWAEVRVRDDGIGIRREQLATLFEMFAQIDQPAGRAPGGLGIGLNLVQGLVEIHGGTVEAFSEGPGMGSEFLVRLPLAEAPARSNGHAAPARAENGACRVLVVDDNRDGAKCLAMMLELFGHETHLGYDGREALALAEQHRPQVVLLDIGLPALNGYEVAKQIRASEWGRGMLLVAQTGWGQEDDKARAEEAGFDHHLVKPIDPTALRNLLAEIGPRD